MRRSFLRLFAALSLASFAAACSDTPTNSGTPGGNGSDAQIGFAVNLAGIPVNLLVVEVTAADITTPLAFNIPVSNGTATGNLSVPPGSARTITVRAYDANGTMTHEGSATVDVRPGQNVNVPITLTPRAGHVPISINIGSIVVGVTRARAMPAGGDVVGDTTRLAGTVTYPNGSAIPGARVSWATLNPAIATVDSLGLVTARAQGSTRIVATYGGHGASIDMTFILADGTNGSQDRTPPQLTDFGVFMDSVDMAWPTPPESENTQSVTFSMTATDATGVYAFGVTLRSPDGQTSKYCFSSTSATPGSTTLYCSVALSRYGQAGRWVVEDLSIGDGRGNGRNFTAAELAAAGFDSGVFVYNTSVDNIAPVLDSIQFTPDTLRVDQGERWVTVRAYVTDTQAGVDEISFGAQGVEVGYGFGGQLMRNGPGIYEASFDAGSNFAAGRAAITSVFIRDRAGNATYLNDADLAARGISAILTVIR